MRDTFIVWSSMAFIGVCAWGQEVVRKSPRTQAVSQRPLLDHCRGAVDPYIVSGEKMRFFAAAGKDSELTGKEFAANRSGKNPKPFARKFDNFRGMTTFDANKNGTIDWLEADAYRRRSRKRVMGAFDVNKNGHLRGAERKKANQALEAGKIPPPVKKRSTAASRMFGEERNSLGEEMLEKYDANGDGVLSEEEIQTAMKDMQESRRSEMMARYDTDRDGKLSEAERKAMLQDRAGAWQKMQKRLRMRLFDEDGDGRINEEEKARQREFGEQFQQVANEMRLRMFDVDGDGQISKEERSLVQKEMMIVGIRVMIRSRRLMDGDGDGKVSAKEQSEFQARMAENFGTWVEGFSDMYDVDGNGRFDDEERGNLIQGIRGELDNRMTKHDTNKDGRTDPFEMEKLMFDFGRDIGVVPRKRATTGPESK